MKKITIFLAVLALLGLLCTACGSSNEQDAAAEQILTTLGSADALYQSGKYAQSLDQYLTVMEQDARNMDARIGVVKCQIELGNYELADLNLSMAEQADPGFLGVCEAYIQMGQATGDPYYGQQAVTLAVKYNHMSILTDIPAAPTVDLPAGSYAQRTELSIACEDPEAQIYVHLSNSQNPLCNLYNMKYSRPILLLQGENTLSVFSMKNGIPSQMEIYTYFVAYDPVEVTFQEPLMEELVRKTLGKADGPITNYDCEQITSLSWQTLRTIYTKEKDYQKQKLHSLEDLQHLPVLQMLMLEYQTEIEDFSPLAKCTQLWDLTLQSCGLTDTEFTRYTPNVTSLSLYFNKITDFSALENLEELLHLYINNDDTGAKLDQVLQNCGKIVTLTLDDTLLEDYSVLSQLPNLTSLTFYGYTKVDYAAIGELTQLETLNLLFSSNRSDYGKSVGDISFLPKLQNLKYTYWCGVNKVSDLEYFKQLPNLEQLVLSNSDATSNEAAMEALIQALPNCQIIY